MDYETVAFEKVSLADAKLAIKGETAPVQAAEQNWEAKRDPEMPFDKKLADETCAWLVALPPEVRPLHLARKFPRIANKIASVWKRPINCDKVFADLMIDNRGTRTGFPVEIAKEITDLRAYYNTVICVDKQELWTLTL